MSSKSQPLAQNGRESNLLPTGAATSPSRTPRELEASGATIVGRYEIFEEFASGGMATVHFGRLLGPAGFSRLVAIKRLHPQLAKEAEFVSMFIDEVRLAARIQHPNVVATLDVVEENELFLVMEYVHGVSLAELVRCASSRGLHVPAAIASSVACGLLHGLHAAHEATSETGEPLGIIHRDVSPQNVIIGSDGVARVLDFGIARAARRLQNTREGQLKGKLAYLAPERVHGRDADRRSDVYGAAVVLWEMLTGAQLFDGENEAAVLSQIVSGAIERPSQLVPGVPPALEAIVLRGMDRDPENRFATAREMALALQQEVGIVAPSDVGDWVASIAADWLSERARAVARLDGSIMSEAGRARAGAVRPGGRRGEREPHTRPVPRAEPLPPTRTVADASAASATDTPRFVSNEIARPKTRGRAGVGASVSFAAIAAIGFGAYHLRAWWPAARTKALADESSSTAITARATLAPEGQPPPNAAPTATAPTVTAPPLEGPSITATSLAAAPSTDVPSETLPSTAARAAAGDPPSKPNARSRPPTKQAQGVKTAEIGRKPPSSTPDAPLSDPCRPPYTVDSAGVKHFKVDCVIDGRR